MSETNTPTEPKRKQLYYTNVQVKEKLIDLLRTNKIGYLSLRVSTKEIEVAQLGEHESAGEIMKLFTAPGIYGPSGTNPTVRLVKDGFGVVTRTVITLPRDGAEPMFADDGVNDDDEGTESSPDASEVVEDTPNVVVAPIEFTPEAFDQYTEAELDDVLEGHGVDPAEFDSAEAKLDAAKKIVFID